ncbi:MAG TPA: hypothetical protein ENI33_09020 [Thermoplasmatales archaeon]|nr:hypothetical protein [Thermoplasmatales archaeon]
MEACDETIKELSSIYDEESMDTFVSLYFDGKDNKFIYRREEAVMAILKGEELENFLKTMEEIKRFLGKKFAGNVAIFASHKHGYLKVVDIPVKTKNALIVDSSPYIRPLAELTDTWESFTLVLLNTNHARIFSVSCSRIAEKKRLSAYIMNKHKKGGWSQARFQRLRKGSIHAFFVEVMEELEKYASENIIIAGPGQAKHEFKSILPKRLQEKVVDIIDVDIEDEHGLFKESMAVMAEKEMEEKRDTMQYLKKEILRDGLGVCGVDEVVEASRNGQIELLLIEKGYKLRGWICENCQAVGKGTAKDCPYCHGKTSEVDVIEEIIEFAERTDAKVEFISSDEIKNLGHVVALLRYK